MLPCQGLSVCPAVCLPSVCLRGLGVEDGNISDSQLRASSSWGPSTPDKGRLHGSACWRPSTSGR